MSEFTIVGEQEQALGVGVETTHMEEPFLAVGDVVADVDPAEFVVHARHDTQGLVEGQVDAGLIELDPHPVHVDDLARVDPDPELTDHLAIDLDATVGDQLLTHPPRADASGGQHLLQARALRVMDVDEGFARPLRGFGRL